MLRFNGADDGDLFAYVYDMKLTFDLDGPHIHSRLVNQHATFAKKYSFMS